MRRALLLAAIAGLPLSVFGQIPSVSDLARKIADRVPGLSKILEAEPALTTSLEDAYGELPMLDDWQPDPEWFEPMRDLARDASGGFVLRPGYFRLDAESYCLHAGTAGPRGGDGFVLAPLAGPRGDIVESILRESVAHPGVSQAHVQSLLWAVLARAKVADLNDELREAATALLTRDQIYELDGGALGRVPADLREEAFGALPDIVRRTLEAEAELRERLAAGDATFEELEAIAVPDRDPEWQDGDREIPAGRWSFHPDGFAIRFASDSYHETRIEVVVPEPVDITRDALGRIVRMVDRAGNAIETVYDAAIAPFDVPDDPGMRGYAFKRIRYLRPDEGLSAEWVDTGWTFVGVPGGPPLGAGPLAFGPVRLMPARWAPGSRAGDKPFENWVDRYDKAKGHWEQAQEMRERWERARGPRSWDDIRRHTDIKHYEEGLKTALGGDLTEKGKWIAKHSELTIHAWQYATCQLGGGCDGSPQTYRPSRHAAVPGRGDAQRLGLSGR